jgi:hypothetical protein
MILITLSIKNVYSAVGLMPPLSHLTCIPTKSNFYFDICSAKPLHESALYRLLTFHVLYLMAIFFRSGHLSKESVQAHGPL